MDSNELGAYMVTSSVSDSRFSEESSDVESYHHSKLRQMTHAPLVGGAGAPNGQI